MHSWCKTVLISYCTHFSAPIMGYERLIFWFWESPTTGWHARCMQGKKKTLTLSYNMHLLVPYLLNDFQTIRLTIHFSKPSFASR